MLIASRHPSRHAAKVTQPSPLFVRLAGFANYESTESFSNLPSRDIVPDTSESCMGWRGGKGGGKGNEAVISLCLKKTSLKLRRRKIRRNKSETVCNESSSSSGREQQQQQQQQQQQGNSRLGASW
ncbi:hypothetical protein E2C01_013748 [Portunus trituberculatus]|uniref:Uncharacterized protein n=1 Tax=Portunus trituberculatus TaxID=210409 RepID=A0A5B7DIB3_PORTR|nr:hypothetical protein [Portunus trituberculatus]